MIKSIMRKLHLTIFLLGVALFVSCNDNDIPMTSNDESETNGPNYEISPDSALAYLNEFLNSDKPDSRSINNRKVASISPVKYPKMLSRSSEDSIDCENLVYVANFEQEQGYAILAADKRISEKVIAVADSGNLNPALVNSATGWVAIGRRPVIDGYPTTGPGFLTLPECGDEVFINPNTVSMYDKVVNDTLVGGFYFDDFGAVNESGTPIQPQGGSENPELLTGAMCVSYAITEIQDYEDGRKNFHLNDDTDLRVEDGGGISHQVRYEYSYSDWVNKKTSPKLLWSYRSWHQRYPFNSLFPHRRKLIIIGHRRQASTGCFPLAIAKVLTHLRHPDVYTYNGYTVNWVSLSTRYPESVFEASAASLLRGIAQGCGSWYFYKGTFTFPNKAISYMKFIGMPGVSKHHYNFDLVTNMIDNNKPVIIYSLPDYNIFKSHCWNIDGYKIKERTVTTKHYVGYTLTKTTTAKETCKMVHCDFGWSGHCNGYYVSGVFKLNDPNRETDNPNDGSEDNNYNTHTRIITYDMP